VERVLGDTRAMQAASLRRAISGAGEVEEHERLIHSLVELHCSAAPSLNWKEISQHHSQMPGRSDANEAVARQRLAAYRTPWFLRASNKMTPSTRRDRF
jgi:hypothetical protein